MLNERSGSGAALDSAGGAESTSQEPASPSPSGVIRSNSGDTVEKNWESNTHEEQPSFQAAAATCVVPDHNGAPTADHEYCPGETLLDSAAASESASAAVEFAASQLADPQDALPDPSSASVRAQEMSPGSEAIQIGSQSSAAFASPAESPSSSPRRSAFASPSAHSCQGGASFESEAQLSPPPFRVDSAEARERTPHLASSRVSALDASIASPSGSLPRASEPLQDPACDRDSDVNSLISVAAPSAPCDAAGGTGPSPEYFDIYTPAGASRHEEGTSLSRGPDSVPTSQRGSLVSSFSAGAARTGASRSSLTSVSSGKLDPSPVFKDPVRQSLSSVSDVSETAAVFLSHLQREGGEREDSAASGRHSSCRYGQDRRTPGEKLAQTSRLASCEGSLLQPLPGAASDAAATAGTIVLAQKAEITAFLARNRQDTTSQEGSGDNVRDGPFSQLLAEADAELRVETLEETELLESDVTLAQGEESHHQSLVRQAYNLLYGNQTSSSEDVSDGSTIRGRRQSVPGFFGSQASVRLPVARPREASLPRARRGGAFSPSRVDWKTFVSMSLRDETETGLSSLFDNALGRFDARENSAPETDKLSGADGVDAAQGKRDTVLLCDEVQDIIDGLSGPQNASADADQRFRGVEKTDNNAASLLSEEVRSLKSLGYGQIAYSREEFSYGEASLQSPDRDLRLAVGFVAPHLPSPAGPAVFSGASGQTLPPATEERGSEALSPALRERRGLIQGVPASGTFSTSRPRPCAIGSWTSVVPAPVFFPPASDIGPSASASLLPRLLPSPASSCATGAPTTKASQFVLPSPSSSARPAEALARVYGASLSPFKGEVRPASPASLSSSESTQSDPCVWGACADSSGALFMSEEETAQLWREAQFSNALLDYVSAVFRRMVEFRELLASQSGRGPGALSAEEGDLVGEKEIADFWMTYAPLQREPYLHGVEPRATSASPGPAVELHLDAGRLARVLAGPEGLLDLVRFTRLLALVDGDIPHSLQSAAGLLRLRLIFLFFSDLPNVRGTLGELPHTAANDKQERRRLVQWREWNWQGFRHTLLHTPAVTQGGVAACPESLRAALATLGKPGHSVATFADFHALVAGLIVRGTSRLFRINLFSMQEGPEGLLRVPRFPLDSLPYPPLIVRRRVLCCTVPTCPCQWGGPCATATTVEAQETGDALKVVARGSVSWVTKPHAGETSPETVLQVKSLGLPTPAQSVPTVAAVSPSAQGSYLRLVGGAFPPVAPPSKPEEALPHSLPGAPASPLYIADPAQVSPQTPGAPEEIGPKALGPLRVAPSASLTRPAVSMASKLPVRVAGATSVGVRPSFVSPMSGRDGGQQQLAGGTPLHPAFYSSRGISGPLESEREGKETVPVLLHAPNLLLPFPSQPVQSGVPASSLMHPQSLPFACGRPSGTPEGLASPAVPGQASNPGLAYAGEVSPTCVLSHQAIKKEDSRADMVSVFPAPAGPVQETRVPFLIQNHYTPLSWRGLSSPAGVLPGVSDSEIRPQLQYLPPHPKVSFFSPSPVASSHTVRSDSRPLGSAAAAGEGAAELQGLPARARVVAEVSYEARHKDLFDRIPLMATDFANLPVLDVRQIGGEESDGLLRQARAAEAVDARGLQEAGLLGKQIRHAHRESNPSSRPPLHVPVSSPSSFASSSFSSFVIPGRVANPDIGGARRLPAAVGSLVIAAGPVPPPISRSSFLVPSLLPQPRGHSERRVSSCAPPLAEGLSVAEAEPGAGRSRSRNTERCLRRSETPAVERSEGLSVAENARKAANGLSRFSASRDVLNCDARSFTPPSCSDGGPLAPPCLASPEAHSPVHAHRPRAIWMREERRRIEQEEAHPLALPHMRSPDAGDARRRSERPQEKARERLSDPHQAGESEGTTADEAAPDARAATTLASNPVAILSNEEVEGLQRGLRLASFERYCVLQRLAQTADGRGETSEVSGEKTPPAEPLFVQYELSRVERDFAEAIFAPFLYTFCFLLEKQAKRQSQAPPSPNTGAAPVSPLGVLRVLQDTFSLLTKRDMFCSSSLVCKDALDLAAEVACVLCPAPFRPGRVIAFVCCLHWLRERGLHLRRLQEGPQAPEEAFDCYSLLPLLPFSAGDRLEPNEVAHVVGPSIRAIMGQMETGFNALLSGEREREDTEREPRPARPSEGNANAAESAASHPGGESRESQEPQADAASVGGPEPEPTGVNGFSKATSLSKEEELERRMATRTTAGDARGWSCVSFQSVSASHVGDFGVACDEGSHSSTSQQVSGSPLENPVFPLPGKEDPDSVASVASGLIALPPGGARAPMRMQKNGALAAATRAAFSAGGATLRVLPKTLQSAGEKDGDRSLGVSLSSAESLQEPRPRSRGGEPTFTGATALGAVCASEQTAGCGLSEVPKEREFELKDLGEGRPSFAGGPGDSDGRPARDAFSSRGRRGHLPTPKPVLPDLGVQTALGERGCYSGKAGSRVSSATRSVSSESFVAAAAVQPDGRTWGPYLEHPSRRQGPSTPFEVLPELHPSDRLPRSRRPTVVASQTLSVPTPATAGVSPGCHPSLPPSEARHGLFPEGPEGDRGDFRSPCFAAGENEEEDFSADVGFPSGGDEVHLPRHMHPPLTGARPSRSLLSDSLGSLVEDIVTTPPLVFSGFTTPREACPEQARLKEEARRRVKLSNVPPPPTPAEAKQTSFLSPETEGQAHRGAALFSPPTVVAAVAGVSSDLGASRKLPAEPQRSSLPLRRSPSLVFPVSPRAEAGAPVYPSVTEKQTGGYRGENDPAGAVGLEWRQQQGPFEGKKTQAGSPEGDSTSSRIVSPLEELLMAERETFFSPAAPPTDAAPESQVPGFEGGQLSKREGPESGRGDLNLSPPCSPSALSNSLAEFFIGRKRSTHADCSPASPPRPFSPPFCDPGIRDGDANDLSKDASLPHSFSSLQKLSEADLLELNESRADWSAEASRPRDGLSTPLGDSEKKNAEAARSLTSPTLAAAPFSLLLSRHGSRPLSTNRLSSSCSSLEALSDLPSSGRVSLSSSVRQHSEIEGSKPRELDARPIENSAGGTGCEGSVSAETPEAPRRTSYLEGEEEPVSSLCETRSERLSGSQKALEAGPGAIEDAAVAIAHAAAARAFRAAQENETAQCLEAGRMAVAVAAAAAAAGGTRRLEKRESSLGVPRRQSSSGLSASRGDSREEQEGGRRRMQETPSFWKRRGLAAAFAAAAVAEARAERRTQEEKRAKRDDLRSRREVADLEREVSREASEEVTTAVASANLSFGLGGSNGAQARCGARRSSACDEPGKNEVLRHTANGRNGERGDKRVGHPQSSRSHSSLLSGLADEGDGEKACAAEFPDAFDGNGGEASRELADLAVETPEGKRREEPEKAFRRGSGSSGEAHRGSSWEEGEENGDPHFGRHSRNWIASADDSREGEDSASLEQVQGPQPASLEGCEARSDSEYENAYRNGVPASLANEI
ncbi:hypothetical protein TGRUB_229260 [Toxoplasma gondii RUB]|uniref:Uncharacterized protein n=1 Tax=Toxoplasma gondii RUB TaxID=935652 RepID=A0A086M3K7_TOXGO|nr:hypothetical protein TGRUB_229260 [Toxoplasma gondii RUB]